MHRIHNLKTSLEVFDAEIVGGEFKKLIMERARFSKVRAERSEFEATHFDGSTFTDCDFTGVAFANCQFVGATIDGILIEDLLNAYRGFKRSSDTPK